MSLLKKILKFCFIIVILGALLTIGVFAYFAKDLPNPAKLKNPEITQSTKIYDRTGEVILYNIHNEIKRTIVPFSEIPDHVKQATITIEDDNFYNHIGIDWKAILRAAWADLKKQDIAQGGSTITQQFIKNAYLGGPQAPRTFTRKIKEVILTLEMERRYSKDEILNFYLNQVPYGSNAYGIEAAAQTFFNKSAKELTLSESSFLAALPRAPSYYSPFGSHPDELEQRQNKVLDRMVEFDYITKKQAKKAKKEEIKFANQKDLKAHHFVTMIKEYLEKNYGDKYGDINRAGLKVYTTLDWDLQQIAKQAVAEGAKQNQEKYNANNAALVAIDPQSGQLLSLIGSRNYQECQFNVATSPYRHPGSSFKPFTYSVLMEKGFTPQSILFDLPTSFGPSGNGGEYEPQNYDLKFRGPISLRQSLAQSVNVTSVKALYLAGIDNTINLAQKMGISTLENRNRYGLSLVLGGGEVKLLDEVLAYSAFANEGIKHPLSMILKIKDANGNTLEEYKNKSEQVLSRKTALQITDILSDESARAPVFGNYSKLYLPNIPAAAKTGTTQNYSDGWTVGYTPNLVTGVWVGNNDYTNKMKRGASGLRVAAPIWNDFMQKAYKTKNKKTKNKEQEQEGLKPNEFTLPENPPKFNQPPKIASSTKPMINGQIAWNKKIKIDQISNKRATNLTPPELTITKIYPQIHSILYYINKENPLSSFPDEPSNDPQFLNWEKPVLDWAQNQPCKNNTCYNEEPSQEYDDIHISKNQPQLQIIEPDNNDYIDKNSYTKIKAKAKANLGIKQLDFFFNNQLIGTDSKKPFSITFYPASYLNKTTSTSTPTTNNTSIKVRAYDKVLNKKEKNINIKIND